jgi:hypothetical protein
MPKRMSKRAIEEEEWMETAAGRLIVAERRIKRAIRACERTLRHVEECRQAVRNGTLSEEKFREIVGDHEQEAREGIVMLREILAIPGTN